ncbi:MAG: TetM/TetW/TetO/TetS family tetracycline resistance ribosomal protection protein [Chloroflexi bacterium]|nr:TetM/TetW/TetO/TetS family tetracycline resistance ribosomal protection protein [Chloroflexota bacterium]
MSTINLGILAHVDAGKTSLTERLLHAAGVIDEIGNVDDGTTQTDSLALERQRGITIKSAVASFTIDDVAVNLIDTPGHPDFIAEVERVLGVLDGVVLVLSAVEGVQAQARVLMRTLRRLQLPTLLFVNKIDRRGADPERVLADIAAKLTPSIVPMGTVHESGSREAEFVPFAASDPAFVVRLAERLADYDEALLAAFVDGAALDAHQLRRDLARQTGRALVHPVFFGSAITGAGVPALMAGIRALLPMAKGSADAPLSGTVFKVERGPDRERIAYLRLFSGTVHLRDRLRFASDDAKGVGRAGGRTVTALSVFERGSSQPRPAVTAGQIARLWGLGDVQIGDTLGERRAGPDPAQFAPPTLESAVVPRRPEDKAALHAALTQLSEQDPLINLRQDDARNQLVVSLYGEVQKEVIQATLADTFQLDVEFRDSTVICVERPLASGAALDQLGEADNPFHATVGLRVEPAALGAGVQVRLEPDLAGIPLYIYGSANAFRQAVDEAVHVALAQGLSGWRVVDCVVTVTHTGYVSPVSTAADFRRLTPLVLMRALSAAGTEVCEPMHRYQLEIPMDTFGVVAQALARIQALPTAQASRGASYVLEGEVAVAQLPTLQQQVPRLTHGEGVLESAFDRYQPVPGLAPSRARPLHHPLNRKAYLAHALGRS